MTEKFKKRLIWHITLSLLIFLAFAFVENNLDIFTYRKDVKLGFITTLFFSNIVCGAIFAFPKPE